ncbi:GxxExxY protein [Thermoplasmatales archaeon SW_10_69_26]|nr:MAG: GxxExxY protein [Thermoplasmatales archaeon SW_10_69_26]
MEEEPSRSLNALSRDVIGAAIEVHEELGPGLVESAYASCLTEVLRDEGHEVSREVCIPARFRGRELDAYYRLDLTVDERLVLEIKAVEELHAVHKSQLLTYLEMAEAPLGLLINFNVPKIVDGLERVVC